MSAVPWEDKETIAIGSKKTALRCIVAHAVQVRDDAISSGNSSEANELADKIAEIRAFAQLHGLGLTDSVVADLLSGLNDIREGWVESYNHWNPSNADC